MVRTKAMKKAVAYVRVSTAEQGVADLAWKRSLPLSRRSRRRTAMN